MVLVAVGTGVGGAFVLDDRVLLGATGRAGHFGHLAVPEADGVPCPCGAVGHAEAVGGGLGIVATYHRLRSQLADTPGQIPRVGREGVTVASLVDRESEDAEGHAAIDLGARAVGTLIGGLINALEPEVVVVGGGVAKSGGSWWPTLTGAAEAARMSGSVECPIVRSTSGAEMALLGAVRHAVESSPR
jgi:glucokinase